MSATSQWLRVSKQQRCLICDHSDWCTYTNDGGKDGKAALACCMRLESGKPAKNGGWIHKLGDNTKLRPLPLPVKAEKPVTINAPAIMDALDRETMPEMLQQLAGSLGVSVPSLESIGCAWSSGHKAFAFPMKDAEGATIGIRLRDPISGHKWAIKGSRAGLFYAEGESKTAYVAEGPTDTAAGLTMGMATIGRPSCHGSEDMINAVVRRKGARRVVIMSDNDGPGYRGAIRLIETLSVPCVIWMPPCKDLRQFLQQGGTAADIDCMTKGLVWIQPKKKQP